MALAACALLVVLGPGAGSALAKHKHRAMPLPRGTVVSRSNFAVGVAVQPDGRVVTAGYQGKGGMEHFAVNRRLENGRTDPAFARPLIEFGAAAAANLVALQPDGKIVLAGVVKAAGPSADGSSTDFALARLLPDGSLDPTFGAGGITRTDLGADDTPNSIELQPDGKILLAGQADFGYPDGANPDSRFAVARYNANGGLDPTFGGSGKTTISFGGFADALAVHAGPGGDVSIAGYHQVDPGALGISDVARARLTESGVLDPSFGPGGKMLTPFLSPAETGGAKIDSADVYTAAYTRDGRLAVAGPVSFDRGKRRLVSRVKVERFANAGSPDSGFAFNGTALIRDSAIGRPNVVDFPSEGGLVVAGGGSSPASLQLVRLTDTGLLDPVFGRKGAVRTRLRGLDGAAFGSAIDPSGRILVAGWAELREERPGLSVLARYLPSGKLDKGFGPRYKRRHRRHRHHAG